jgi:hypothetical protein
MCFSVFERVAFLMSVPTKAPSCSKSSLVCRTYKKFVWGENKCDIYIYLSSSICVSLFGYLGINESTKRERALTLSHLKR